MVARALAQFVFGRNTLASRLERSPLAQFIARKTNARGKINAALSYRPVRRKLPESGVRYEMRDFESLSVEKMYFGNPAYTEILKQNPPRTFVDLGCNAGLFPCFVAHMRRNAPLAGLCIDANEKQLKLAAAQAKLNDWGNIHYRVGAVGASSGDATATDFYLHPTSLGSSRFPYQGGSAKSAWKKMSVPSIDVYHTWTELFGPNAACDILKIDVEGSEKDFILQESSFLKKTNAILMEWHNWTTNRDEIIQLLGEQDFFLVKEIDRQEHCGVLYLKRNDPAN